MSATLQSRNKNVHIYQGFILLQCFIWGVGNPVTKFIYISMTPFCYMAVRFFIGFLIFMLLFGKHIVKDLTKEKIKASAIVGVFLGGAYICGNLALSSAMVTITGFLMGISVIFTSLFTVIFLRKKLRLKFVGVLAIVIVGMYLLCCGGTGAFSFGLGEFFGIISSAFMGATLILSAKFIGDRDITPYTLSAVQCLVTSVMCTFFGLIFEDFSCMLNVAPISWWAMVYVTLGCTVVAFMLQNVSIKHLSAIFVSLAFCTEPLFTAVASYFMIDERMTVLGIIGSIMITIGVVLGSISDADVVVSDE